MATKTPTNVQLTRAYVKQLQEALAKTEALALAMSSRFDEKDYAALPEEYRTHIAKLLSAKFD